MSYQQVLQEIQAGHFKAAIATVDSLLRADPSEPKLWQAKALALLSSDCPEAAVVAAEQTIRLHPKMAAAHRLLGRIRSRLGDFESAIAAYKKAARCYLKQQDKANAQACLDQIDQLLPQSSLTEQPPTQQPPTQQLQPQRSNSAQAFLQKAIAKIQQGRRTEAFQDLNWLLQLDPDNVEGLAQRGLLQADCQNYPAAVHDLARAMQLSPENTTLRLQRGQIRLRSGDAHGAIEDFSSLLHLQSGDAAQLYTLRGQAYQQIRDFDNAFKDLSDALGLDPHNADCYRARGDIHAAMEDLQEALKHYRRAANLHLDQGNWSNHQQLQDKIQTLELDLQTQEADAARIVRVPIKCLSGGTPVIEVTFNGNCTFDMILDTGASITCLTQPMADLLNIVPHGAKRFSMADGRIVEEPVGFVNAIAVDQAQVNRLEVAISATGTDGLLGQNYFWRYDMRILRTEVELYIR